MRVLVEQHGAAAAETVTWRARMLQDDMGAVLAAAADLLAWQGDDPTSHRAG